MTWTEGRMKGSINEERWKQYIARWAVTWWLLNAYCPINETEIINRFFLSANAINATKCEHLFLALAGTNSCRYAENVPYSPGFSPIWQRLYSLSNFICFTPMNQYAVNNTWSILNVCRRLYQSNLISAGQTITALKSILSIIYEIIVAQWDRTDDGIFGIVNCQYSLVFEVVILSFCRTKLTMSVCCFKYEYIINEIGCVCRRLQEW